MHKIMTSAEAKVALGHLAKQDLSLTLEKACLYLSCRSFFAFIFIENVTCTYIKVCHFSMSYFSKGNKSVNLLPQMKVRCV